MHVKLWWVPNLPLTWEVDSVEQIEPIMNTWITDCALSELYPSRQIRFIIQHRIQKRSIHESAIASDWKNTGSKIDFNSNTTEIKHLLSWGKTLWVVVEICCGYLLYSLRSVWRTWRYWLKPKSGIALTLDSHPTVDLPDVLLDGPLDRGRLRHLHLQVLDALGAGLGHERQILHVLQRVQEFLHGVRVLCGVGAAASTTLVLLVIFC